MATTATTHWKRTQLKANAAASRTRTATTTGLTARNPAERVADIIGWDDRRITEEPKPYQAYVARMHAASIQTPATAA